MKNFSRKIILGLLFYITGLFFYSSCSTNNTEQKVSIENKIDTLLPPVSVVITHPITPLPDTCKPPHIIIVPTEPTNKTIIDVRGDIVKLAPPETKPASFLSQMQNYNADHGLALDGVVSSYMDKSGNLWFGTSGGGVSRYNGKSFTNFTTAQGLANNYVWSIIEDKSGNIWFGTNGGASRYDGKSFTNFTTVQGLGNNGVLKVMEDRLGKLWFGTNGGGVSCFNGKAFTNFTNVQGLAGNIVWGIAEDKTGNLWFGTAGEGVSCYDGNRVEAIERGDARALKNQRGIKKINGKFVKSFINYTTQQGLPDNNVLCIMEDKWGKLWFGTDQGGVSCYNGNQMDTTETCDTIVRNTQQDIRKIKKEFVNLFINYSTAQGLVGNRVLCITEDKSGNLWFGTQNGVSTYVRPTNINSKWSGKENLIHFTNFTTAQGLPNNCVYNITEDKTGNLWFCTYGGGVSRYDGKSLINSTVAQGLTSSNIWSIAEDKTGNLWLGTNSGGVIHYDGNRIEAIEDGDTMAARTQDDIKKVNGRFMKSFTKYDMQQGLVFPSVLDIAEDKLGNLWLGTYIGLSRYDGNRVKAIERGDTFALKTQQDLKKVNGKFVKTFTNYTTDQGLAHNSVLSILADKQGNLWFGSKKGVSYCDRKYLADSRIAFTNYTTEQGLVSNMVTSIIEDKTGNLWFGTGGGVSCYDGNRVDVIESGDATAMQNIKGLKKVNGKFIKTFTNYTTAQGLPNNKINCITEDKNGNLWFGTDGGASRYDGKTFLNFSTAQGLPDNVIAQILITQEQNILFGTNSGVAMLTSFASEYPPPPSVEQKQSTPPENSLSNKELKKYTPVFEIYNTSTGYPVRDVNTGQNSMFLDSKGIIWISTGSDKTGLVRFDYKALNKNNKPLDVCIQSIKINSENILWNDLISTQKAESVKRDSTATPANITEEVTALGKTLSDAERDTMRQKFGDIKFDSIKRFYPIPENLILPYEHNHITFDFTAIEPARPYLVRYQYILEGYDKEWSPITDKTEAVFGNMYEGSYTFKLKARSPFGIWSEPIEYKFRLLPPWWRSWWMKIVYGIIFLLIIVLVYFYVMYRIKTIRKYEEEKTLENKKREEEKTMLNKQLSDIKMKALRSQMNPHFIFNVMNSVQNYILENDRVTAQDYLAKFARLMRQVLENSKAENITLENEIETLRLYVMLEQLRAPGKFTYKVDVEPSISTMDTLIIPMLIQPFIENAIIHGIMHRDGNEGKIKLTIKKSNDQLVCVIEDNGIGRKSAQKIKSARSHTHKSLGMNVTEERISIINNLHGKNTSVTIEDLADENMNPSGTKVTLTIPYVVQNN